MATAFTTNLEALRVFVEQYGRPPKTSENKTLATWVMNRRLEYKKGSLLATRAQSIVDTIPGWGWDGVVADAMMRDVAKNAVTRSCHTCGLTKDKHAFEGMRLECMACRVKRRAASEAERLPVDDDQRRQPEICSKCDKPFSADVFTPRGDGYRSQCKACYNDLKYYVTHRSIKRAEDEEGYLAHNAEVHKKWVGDPINAEVVRKARTASRARADAQFGVLASSARQRNIEVETAAKEDLMAMMSMGCHYCDFKPADGEHLNGIDRVDPAMGYTAANSVACCGICNQMKSSYSIDDFVRIVRKVYGHNALGDVIRPLDRPPLSKVFGGPKSKEDVVKDKTDTLTQDRRIDTWIAPCYLCGHLPSLGIDQMDSSLGYHEDNVRPCCSTCNYLKKDIPHNALLTHVAYIGAHTAEWVLHDEPTYLVTANGRKNTPIAALDDEGNVLAVFPSSGTATRLVVKCGNEMLTQVLEGKADFCSGLRWKWISVPDFWGHVGDPAVVRRVLTEVRAKRR